MATAKVTPHVHQCERHPAFNQSVGVSFAKQHGIHYQGYAPLGDSDRSTIGKDLQKDAGITAIAKKMGVSVAQVLLKWQLQDGISVPVRVQSGNPQHVKED